MKVLVTGGCGFIGSHLSNILVKRGYEVAVLDNLISGNRGRLDSNIEFILGDVCNQTAVKKAVNGCSVVFHLAALTDLRTATEEKIREVNFSGSKNVFSAAEENNAKVIFTSSAAVYGDSEATEEKACSPLSYYGKNKLETEELLSEAFIARLFNVYGPYGKSFVNTLCKKIPEGKEITVYGNGSKTRDYIYVDDVVSALLLGIDNKGIFNVGSGTETSVLNLIKKVENVLGKKAVVKHAGDNKNEIRSSRADIGKIKQLGWKAVISLEEGIKKVLEL